MIFHSPYPDVPQTLNSNVCHLLFGRPDQPDLGDYLLYIEAETGKQKTFKEFLNDVHVGATALSTSLSNGGLELSMEKGHVVGIVGRNSVEYVTLIHSLLFLAVPFVLLAHDWSFQELEYALSLSKCSHLFVDPEFLPLVIPVEKLGIAHHNIRLLRDPGQEEAHGHFGEMMNHVKSTNLPQANMHPANNDTIAYLLFTSGTTGLPKAVTGTHGNIEHVVLQEMVVNECAAEVYNPITRVPSRMVSISIRHASALSILFTAFTKPQTVVMLSEWDAKAALNAIQKYNIQRINLIPGLMRQILEYPDLSTIDLSSLENITMAGSRLSSELVQKMQAIIPEHTRITQRYGLSENAQAISEPALSYRDRVPFSMGILNPGISARILRIDGSRTDCYIGEVGELFLKGRTLTIGYFGNEEATRETLVDLDGEGNGKWLKTADLVWADKDGNFFFFDRLRDIVKVSGVAISPGQIEDVLRTDPRGLVADACVGVVSCGTDEKLLCAWIVLSPSAREMIGEKGEKGMSEVIRLLEERCRKSLSATKWLTGGIKIVQKIPKTPYGKVLKRVLEDQQDHCEDPE